MLTNVHYKNICYKKIRGIKVLKKIERKDLLLNKAVWYYYFGNLTQQNISEVLGISRVRVMRLLEQARKTGTIQFRMHPEFGHRLETATKIACTWGLKDVIIIPNATLGMNINENIAIGAANYIKNFISKNAFVNVGYGDTLNRVLNHLAGIVESPISFISMSGGVNSYLPNASSNIFNARLYLIPAPMLVSSPEMVEATINEPSVREILQMVKLSSVTVIGIGAMNDSATILRNGTLTKKDFIYLSMQGAVGDILCHFLDQNGKSIQSDIENRLISIPLETIKSLNNVIGVAAGSDKLSAIRSVLRGHYLDILITDEDTAAMLESK